MATENTVTIVDRSGRIQKVVYIDGSLRISPSATAKPPPSISQSGSTFKLTLQAERKGTKEVADSFDAAAGGHTKEYAPYRYGDDRPHELNFYYAVRIGFSGGALVEVLLAQGHTGDGRNNWWIGGAPISSIDVPKLEARAGGEIFTFALSGGVSDFVLDYVGVRPASPIEHVFVLMLENHSFDNMLARSGIPGIIAATGKDTNSYQGTTYPFIGDAPGSMPTDPGHEFTDVVEQLAGQGAVYRRGQPYPPIDNSGFVANYATTRSEGPTPPPGAIGLIMAGFDTASQLPVLHDLASRFAVCDQWFSSLPGPTWPNRFFLHGASSVGLDHSPTTEELLEWESIEGFRYPHGSIFDALKKARVTYRLYHDTKGPIEGAISQVSAIHGIQLWDVHPLSDLEKDLAKGEIRQYTFIEPNYGDVVSGSYAGGSSQHPIDGVAGGEALIARVYDTIRNSRFWPSSLLVIVYDEHGGFYDHVAPGPAQPPNDGSDTKWSKYGFDFTRYGVRVPAVIVSPKIRPGVDHTVYDHASVLATLEQLFGLQALTERDRDARSLTRLISPESEVDAPTTLASLVTTQPTPTPPSAEVRAARELEPVPEGSMLQGFLGILLKADAALAEDHPVQRAAAVARFVAVRTRGDARAYVHEVMARVEAARAARSTPAASAPSSPEP